MRKQEGECVLCGSVGVTTREHVPPKGLFLKPLPQDMITVDVCFKCNNSHSKDDEYFRLYITIDSDPGSKLRRLFKEKVVGSTLARSPALKTMLAKERDKLVLRNLGRSVKTSDGRLISPTNHHLLQPIDAERIERVAEKIVRCLHFHLYRERLTDNATFIVGVVPRSAEGYSTVKLPPTGSVGIDDEFSYVVQPVADGLTRWVLSFYGRELLDVLVTT